MKKIFFILFFGLLITIPFWFFNIDIKVQKFFYDSNAWKYQNHPLVLFLYNFSIYPALITGIISILILGLSGFYKFAYKFRKAMIVFLLALILGPGLLVNVVGKNFSGRPRPREIIEFGGDWKYKKVFEIGIPGKGHSFPCGHCSMGFIFFAIYVVLRDKKKFKAYLWFLFSLLSGFAIGMVRMAQGAHFLSDVIWTGIITFISAEIAFLISGYVEDYISGLKLKKNKTVEYIITVLLILILSFIFLIATPFYREKKYEFDSSGKNLFISASIDEGDIKFLKDEKTKILLNISGFAFPKRKYEEKIDFKKEDEKNTVNLQIIKSGLFPELNSSINFKITDNIREIVVNSKKGSINYEAKGNLNKCIFYTGNGDIIFSPDNGSEISNIFFKTKKGNIIIFLNENILIKGPDDFFIHSRKGNVVIYNKNPFLSDLLKEKERIKGAKEIIYKSKEAGGINLNIISDGVYIQ